MSEISDEVVDFFNNMGKEGDPEPEEKTEEEAPVEEPIAEPDPEDSAEGDAPAAEADPEAEVATAEGEPEAEAVDWEKRYKDQQSFHDQRMQELQQRMDQANQWMQTVYQQMQSQQQQAQQPQPQRLEVTQEELVEAVEQDPRSSFMAIVQHRPDLVPHVVAITREKHGNVLADQMQHQYTELRANQVQQQYEARLQEQVMPAQIQQEVARIAQGVEEYYGEAFTEVRDEVAKVANDNLQPFMQYLQQNQIPLSPDVIANFLQRAYLDVREAKLTRAASQPKQPTKVVQQVETPNTGGGSVEVSDEQAAINEILDGARKMHMDITTS